jgi:hypothetical protein
MFFNTPSLASGGNAAVAKDASPMQTFMKYLHKAWQPFKTMVGSQPERLQRGFGMVGLLT